MDLMNVSMVIAPNFFVALPTRQSLDDVLMAAKTSHVVRLLIKYRKLLWTVSDCPPVQAPCDPSLDRPAIVCGKEPCKLSCVQPQWAVCLGRGVCELDVCWHARDLARTQGVRARCVLACPGPS